jgi:Ner family transcriptional regulator
LPDTNQEKAGVCTARPCTKGIPMKQQEPTMDWPAIVADLHRRGMTLTELANRNDIAPYTIRKVKSVTHYKSQAAIAEFLGQKPEDLWPSRYPKGKPRILDIAKNPRPERKNAQAAADKQDAA